MHVQLQHMWNVYILRKMICVIKSLGQTDKRIFSLMKELSQMKQERQL